MRIANNKKQRQPRLNTTLSAKGQVKASKANLQSTLVRQQKRLKSQDMDDESAEKVKRVIKEVQESLSGEKTCVGARKITRGHSVDGERLLAMLGRDKMKKNNDLIARLETTMTDQSAAGLFEKLIETAEDFVERNPAATELRDIIKQAKPICKARLDDQRARQKSATKSNSKEFGETFKEWRKSERHKSELAARKQRREQLKQAANALVTAKVFDAKTGKYKSKRVNVGNIK